MVRPPRYEYLVFVSLFLSLGLGCGGAGQSSSQGMQNSPNPVPILTSLSPSSAAASGPAFTLNLEGTQFIPTSQVRWNGSQVPTTYKSNTSLKAQIPASDVSLAGTASVTVQNPAPGGGTSTALTFTTSTEILYAANAGNAIFAFQMDPSGALTQTASISPGGNTVSNSALAITPAGTFVYAVNDTVAGINGYATNSSGTLSLIAGSPFPILPSVQPPWPVVNALTTDPTGRFVYAGSGAGYGGVASFSIDGSSGALTATGGPFSTFSQTSGTGGRPVGIAIDPSATFLYATDQYQSVWGFKISPQDGTLTSIAGSPFVAGSQPFGLQVDPSGKFLYVALSNSNGIAAFAIASGSGALTAVPGSPFQTAAMQFTQTYALTIHPSGKFLYAFNFNGNTVAAFTINSSTGVLTPIAGSPFLVNPNAEGGLIVDPSGNHLYLTIGSGPPSAFVIFDIDQTTGSLTPNLQSPISGGEGPLGLVVAAFPKP